MSSQTKPTMQDLRKLTLPARPRPLDVPLNFDHIQPPPRRPRPVRGVLDGLRKPVGDG